MRTAFTDLVGVEHPIVGFNRSPGVVAEVTNAGGLGVLAASAYTPAELDAQLTWIDQQVAGRPYGVDLLVPEKFAAADPDDVIASLPYVNATKPAAPGRRAETIYVFYAAVPITSGRTVQAVTLPGGGSIPGSGPISGLRIFALGIGPLSALGIPLTGAAS